MNNKLEIQEFFVEGNDQQTSHVLLHLAEPVSSEEKKRGYFFALIEINESHPEQITQLQEIIDDIETEYYEIEDFEDDTFEKIIQRINKQSHHILNYKESEINAIVGTLSDSRLILAYHGIPNAVLYYSTNDGLKETIIIEDDTTSANQLFSAVVEGDINNGDYIYISTPHVDDYFSSDRVRKILQSRTTRQSAMHIAKVLESLKNEYSFGGLLLHIPKATQTVVKNNSEEKHIGSQASLNNLLDTTKNTEETLSPPILKHATNKIKNVYHTFKSKNKREEKSKKRNAKAKTTRHGSIETNYRPTYNNKQKENWTGKILILIGRILVVTGTGIFLASKKIIIFLIFFLQQSFYFITNKNGKRTLIIDSTKTSIQNRKYQIKHMGILSKVLLIALLVFVIIFIGSITYIKIRENKKLKLIQYTTLVDTITEKQGEAESKILYGEEEKALELLNEASKLADTLPTKKDEEKETSQKLKQGIDELLQKLRKITIVEPELIVDLSNLEEKQNLTKLVFFDEKIYTYGPKSKTIYAVDPITKNIEQKKHETIADISSADVPKEDDKIVFVAGKNNIYEFEKESQALSNKDITYPVIDPVIKDISIYNRRTYLLSPQNDQIYKHNPIQTGYDKGVEWITEKTDSINNAISLAVDGDIYVLTNDNILKFFSGKQKDFEIKGLDPKLENPTEIWTYSDVDNLYILEPTNKRLILIDKDGNFIKQYTSEKFANPTSMIVQKDQNLIYILDNNKIYKFNM